MINRRMDKIQIDSGAEEGPRCGSMQTPVYNCGNSWSRLRKGNQKETGFQHETREGRL